jgi:uncharacterized protein (TIGR02001 family)
MTTTTKTLLGASLLTLAATGAFAQTAAPAAAEAKPDWSFTGNASLVSDYRFRGISQTNKKPAFQGGFDVAHSSGFYAGNWNSNVDSAFFNGANVEMDFYGGYKLPVGPVTLDFGGLYYYYPGSGANGTFSIHNTELYVGAVWGPASLKYSYSVSDFFGIDDSKGSWYLDGNYAYDLGNGFGLTAHVGYQRLRKNARVVEINSSTLRSNVIDWKLGATYDIAGSGFIVGAAYVGTNRDLTGGTGAPNRNLSNGTVVVSLSKSF